MRNVVCCMRAYGRIGLISVILLSVFLGCSGKTGNPPEKVSQLQNIPLPQESKDLEASIEEVKKDGPLVIINGWAAVKGQDSKDSTAYCVLKSGAKTLVFDTLRLYKRPDVTTYFKIDRDDSGFNAIIPVDRLAKGEYQIGILIRKGKAEHLQYFAKKVSL